MPKLAVDWIFIDMKKFSCSDFIQIFYLASVLESDYEVEPDPESELFEKRGGS
jgi:hypothetical protein